jgi:hypothetical protein
MRWVQPPARRRRARCGKTLGAAGVLAALKLWESGGEGRSDRLYDAAAAHVALAGRLEARHGVRFRSGQRVAFLYSRPSVATAKRAQARRRPAPRAARRPRPLQRGAGVTAAGRPRGGAQAAGAKPPLFERAADPSDLLAEGGLVDCPGPPGPGNSALRMCHTTSVLYGIFVWARRALNSRKLRVLAPGRAGDEALRQLGLPMQRLFAVDGFAPLGFDAVVASVQRALELEQRAGAYRPAAGAPLQRARMLLFVGLTPAGRATLT